MRSSLVVTAFELEFSSPKILHRQFISFLLIISDDKVVATHLEIVADSLGMISNQRLESFRKVNQFLLKVPRRFKWCRPLHIPSDRIVPCNFLGTVQSLNIQKP